MPGMDGFETATHVKQRERTRDIPILFLTAMDADAHQAFRGYAAGAVDYIPKPFDPWVLRAKVAVFVELHERRRALAAQTDELRRQLTVHQSASVERLVSEAANAVSLAQLLADEATQPELAKALTSAADAVAALHEALAAGGGGPPP
jgi:CheY-like chemotaxis protein